MIDKIKAYTSNYSIKKNANLTLLPPPIDYSTGEILPSNRLFRHGFKSVEGERAFCNEGNISLTINDGMVSIVFNPRIIINGNNYLPLTHAEFSESLLLVERSLVQSGIKLDLKSSKLSRVDLCKNIDVDNPVVKYMPALKLLSPRYMPNRTPQIIGGSYLLSNRSKQYSLYDKLADLIRQGLDPHSFGRFHEYVMRVEARFMNKRTVLDSLGVGLLGDLDNKQVYDNLTSKFKQIMKDDFFSAQEPFKSAEGFDSDVDLLGVMKLEHPRKAVEHFYMYKQLTGTRPYSSEKLASIMDLNDYSRSVINERKKQLKDILKLAPSINPTQLRMSDLLNELYVKLVE